MLPLEELQSAKNCTFVLHLLNVCEVTGKMFLAFPEVRNILLEIRKV